MSASVVGRRFHGLAARRVLFLALLALVLLPDHAWAHNRSVSYSVWSIRGSEVIATVTVPAFDATRVPAAESDNRSLAERFAAYLGPRIGAMRKQKACRQVQAPLPLASSAAFVRIETRFECADGPPDVLRYLALLDLVPNHTHFARITRPDGSAIEYLFTAGNTEWRLPGAVSGIARSPTRVAKTSRLSSLIQFIRMGIGHIGSGPDHIAFLATVMLAAAGIRRTMIAVTGFTLGHSLTLSLAVLGIAHPHAALVEALIALTIIIVALESVALRTGAGKWLAICSSTAIAAVGAMVLMSPDGSANVAAAYLGIALFAYCYLTLLGRFEKREGRRRGLQIAVITVVFGMVHGFGFGAFLLSTGLTGSQLLAPLFGFNLGVEIGQLAIVVLLWSVGSIAWKLTVRWRSGFGDTLPAAALSAALCGVGVFWFVTRTFG